MRGNVTQVYNFNECNVSCIRLFYQTFKALEKNFEKHLEYR